MLTGEEIQKLEEFSFGKLLRQIKAERKISFKKMAEMTGIPYNDLYKYARCEQKKPNIVEFYKFMDFLENSTDEFLLNTVGRDNKLAEIRHYTSLLSPKEKGLLDQLNKLDEEQRNKFIDKTSALLNLILDKTPG